MTPIPAMQAAATALEYALPLAKEEWTVRGDWNTVGMAAIAKMESALSLLRGALDAGEPQPAGLAKLLWELFSDHPDWEGVRQEHYESAARRVHALYASPVAAAPQGDAMDAAMWRWLVAQHNVTTPVAQVSWKRGSDPRGEWVNLIDGNDLIAHVQLAALSSPTLNEQGKRG